MAGRSVEAWVAGISAGRDGEPSHANPHERGSDQASYWADGWRDGERQLVAKERAQAASKGQSDPLSPSPWADIQKLVAGDWPWRGA